MQLPGQEMGLRAQAAGVTQQRYDLSQQAMRNRMSLAGLGSQLLGQERQFRISTGERYGTGTRESGGGLGGAIAGGLSGLGAGASIASGLGGTGFAPQFGGFTGAQTAPVGNPTTTMAGSTTVFPQAYGTNPFGLQGYYG